MPKIKDHSVEPANFVTIENGHPITTSLIIAERFGKKHKDVLESIKKVQCSEEFSRRNFPPTSYTDHQNRQQPMFTITRDGFIFLISGFTGAKAARIKEAYISAFNEMESRLKSMSRPALPPPPDEKIIQNISNNLSWLCHRMNELEKRMPGVQQARNLPDPGAEYEWRLIRKFPGEVATGIVYTSAKLVKAREQAKLTGGRVFL